MPHFGYVNPWNLHRSDEASKMDLKPKGLGYSGPGGCGESEILLWRRFHTSTLILG